MILKIYPSRTSDQNHVIETDDELGIRCNCKGFQFHGSCWATKRYDDENFLRQLRPKVKLPDFQTLIKEQWAYIDSRKDLYV